jgi:hypothetical protein
MRVLTVAFRLAAAAVASTAICGPVSVAAAARGPSIAGTWKGPFVGANFIFEFRQVGNGWTGRYQSDKSSKWADLQNINFTDSTVRFSFISQPPSSFTLKVDPAGKTLSGTAKFGPHPPLPLTLTRASS